MCIVNILLGSTPDKTETIGKPFSWYSNRKGDKGLHCHLQRYYINISHAITCTEVTDGGQNEHQAPGASNPQTESTGNMPVSTAIFPRDTTSPEAARAGGGYSNRWGVEKHRNVPSSSLLQKYTCMKGRM